MHAHTRIARTLVAWTLGLVFSLTSCLAVAEEVIGVVLATAGKVEIHRAGTTLTAQRKTELRVKDEISTGDNARAQLRFADGTVTTLGGNTTFEIREYAWQEKNAAPATAQFALLTGAFRTMTGKILEQQGTAFNVKTPVGVIGIRGTDFWGGYLSGSDIDVLLIDGKHAVEINNASGTVFLEKPGQGVTLKADQSKLAVKVWPKEKVNRAVATIAWPDGSTPPTQ